MGAGREREKGGRGECPRLLFVGNAMLPQLLSAPVVMSGQETMHVNKTVMKIRVATTTMTVQAASVKQRAIDRVVS